MNLVLMVLDGLRYDHALTIPIIREIAQRGLWFERMYAPSTFTASVIPSVVSGMYPPRHGQQAWGDKPMGFRKDRIRTLMDFLEGYNQAIRPDWGLGERSFQSSTGTAYHSYHVVHSRKRLLNAIAGDKPFFIYTHWLGIHDQIGKLGRVDKARGVPRDLYKRYVRGIEGYPNAPLKTLEKYLNTLWVIFSDHGIGLEGDPRIVGAGDEGCAQAFDHRTRVMCAIFGPGIRPTPVKAAHSLVDLLPSILDKLGISAKIPRGFLRMQGKSVFGSKPNPYVYTEGFSPYDRVWPSSAPNVFGATDGKIKVVETPLGWEYYDLIVDPEERNPAPLGGAKEARAMRGFIRRIKNG